jgi:phosphate transport system protein
MENHRLFDLELDKLTLKLILMCTKVNRQVKDSLTALINYDLDLAKKVVKKDDEIDNLEIKIDKLCQKIFALKQPVASDLRFILSSLKINNDLERIGDHAVNISKRIELLGDYQVLITILKIDLVCEQAITMFNNVIKLVTTHDLKYCNRINQQSANIKEEYEEIASKIFAEMMEKSDVIVVASNILIILNLIERIASYSNNITESITFAVNGEIVKHKKKQLPYN